MCHLVANLHIQLNSVFLYPIENVDEDLGANKSRTEKLDRIIEDLDSISNGHLENIIVKKEKVKFQVLQNNSDEETPTGMFVKCPVL